MGLPKTCKKIEIQHLSADVRQAVVVKTAAVSSPGDGEVLIRNKYVGINPDDVQLTTGRRFVEGDPPYDLGFEGLGHVVSVGNGVNGLHIGDAVGYVTFKDNAYGEYVSIPAEYVFRVPDVKPEYMVLLVSGLLTSIGLEKMGEMKKNETVLITAAAGGAGHMAVQLAKAAGCFVIGTCSSLEKEKLLKSIGCDRIINYKKEDVSDVLSKEFPKGIDVIWEATGGKMLEICIRNLAEKGRLIPAGDISNYRLERSDDPAKICRLSIHDELRFKNAEIIGFHLGLFADHFAFHFMHLLEQLKSSRIQAVIDMGKPGKEFTGMEGIVNASEYLFNGKNVGKVVCALY